MQMSGSYKSFWKALPIEEAERAPFFVYAKGKVFLQRQLSR